MDLPQVLSVVFLIAFTLTAAVLDLRTRRLPNWLTVPTFLIALVFHGVTAGLAGLGAALAGFAVGFSILLVLWLIGGGGGGDVKLMGALGAWLGWKMTLAVFFLSVLFSVAGSILMMTFLSTRDGLKSVKRKYWNRPRSTGQEPSDEEQRARLQKRRLLPYALPVALGTWLVLAYQVIVKH